MVKDFIFLFVYLYSVALNPLCNCRYSLLRSKCVINASISVFKRKSINHSMECVQKSKR